MKGFCQPVVKRPGNNTDWIDAQFRQLSLLWRPHVTNARLADGFEVSWQKISALSWSCDLTALNCGCLIATESGRPYGVMSVSLSCGTLRPPPLTLWPQTPPLTMTWDDDRVMGIIYHWSGHSALTLTKCTCLCVRERETCTTLTAEFPWPVVVLIWEA